MVGLSGRSPKPRSPGHPIATTSALASTATRNGVRTGAGVTVPMAHTTRSTVGTSTRSWSRMPPANQRATPNDRDHPVWSTSPITPYSMSGTPTTSPIQNPRSLTTRLATA
jgi:hypothetical protein